VNLDHTDVGVLAWEVEAAATTCSVPEFQVDPRCVWEREGFHVEFFGPATGMKPRKYAGQPETISTR
jgi:hypothetical protein